MNLSIPIHSGIALTLGISLGLGSGMALAQPSPTTSPDGLVQYESQGQTQAQIPDERLVLPFTDVPSDHWAYQALLNLAGVYGCVGGYPDGTFQGENAVTRYEFAAGMDACMGVLNDLLQQQQQAQQQELEALMGDLQQSFQELQELEGAL